MSIRKLIKIKRKVLSDKQLYFIGINLSLLFFLIFVLILSFRKIRDAFPPTEIGHEKIVGYTQYFGYPFYLDTIIFFVFVLSPLISVFLIHKIFERKI